MDLAISILPKYFDLVVELIGSFPSLLSGALGKCSDSAENLFNPQDQIKRRPALQILDDIVALDAELGILVERLIRHKKIYECFRKFKYREFDQHSANSNFHAGISKFKMDLEDALHLVKSATTPVNEDKREPVPINDLVVYASRLSKITSAVDGLKSLEAPLPQEHHARLSILFTGPKPQSGEIQQSDDAVSPNHHRHTTYPDYAMKGEDSSVHSEEDRDKWLNLEL